MADYNRNRPQHSDESWEQNREWTNRQHDDQQYGNTGNENNSYMQQRRQQEYGNSGFRHDSAHGRELENQGGYGSGYQQNLGNQQRVNYMPDNDDNRYSGGNYNQYGQAGYQGKQGQQSNDYNPGGYSRFNDQGGFGNTNYGSDNYRQDWGHARVNTQNYGSDNRNQQGYSGYSGGNYGSSNAYDRNSRQNINEDNRYRNQQWRGEQRNVYGGDTSNYGNANQGGWDRDWWEKTKDRVASWFGDDDAERRVRQDRQYSGGHRGKGPRDYQRSAERIREDICDRLYEDDYVDASNIDIKIEGNEVILSGTVRSKEEKRRAEDLVESISGVRNVENRIRVNREGSDASMHQYTGTTDRPGGIGDESGTTNEIIRNEARNRNKNS